MGPHGPLGTHWNPWSPTGTHRDTLGVNPVWNWYNLMWSTGRTSCDIFIAITCCHNYLLSQYFFDKITSVTIIFYPITFCPITFFHNYFVFNFFLSYLIFHNYFLSNYILSQLPFIQLLFVKITFWHNFFLLIFLLQLSLSQLLFCHNYFFVQLLYVTITVCHSISFSLWFRFFDKKSVTKNQYVTMLPFITIIFVTITFDTIMFCQNDFLSQLLWS